jgi:hypothetical protein
VDVLSLLAAVTAVALFPGGLYATAVALAATTGGRLPRASEPWTAGHAAGAVLLVCGAALVPLPGSPALVLPLQTGAPTNLLGALLLVGAGVALTAPPGWPRLRLVPAVAAAMPLLVLAASAATLSFPVVVALPGRELAAARALAAAAILLAAPVLVRVGDHCIPLLLRGLGIAVPALVAAVLLAPPGWSNLPAAAAAAMVVAGVALYGALLGAVVRLLRRRALLGAGAASCAAAIASIVLTALASR